MVNRMHRGSTLLRSYEMRTALCRASLVAAFATWAISASASDPPPAARDPARADALFRSGRAAFKRADYPRACRDFAESARLDPAVGTKLNLSECEEKLGRLASALIHLRAAMGELRPDDERLAIARSRLSDLERWVPRLGVRIASDAPRGTVVLRDGVELAPSALATEEPVDPGEHQLLIRAPRREAKTLSLTLREGETRTIVVSPGAPVVATEGTVGRAPPPTEAADEGSGQRRVGLVASGAGLLVVAAGVFTGLRARSDLRESKDEWCGEAIGQDDPNRCDATGLELRDGAATFADWSTALFVGGGVLLAGGAFLVFGPVLGRTSKSGSSARSAGLQARFATGRLLLEGTF